ncbi:MAG: NAD(P)-dependent glycerol-3-phosphate dehydrogenase [Candidatus Gastranaerophilales bacterium]|nr:NAD(P)-dependent glycerol-3-phosphate dehydrogenase [Candidatus Gastranaerophilales bacterium]
MKLAVIGAGSWGLGLAWLLNDNFEEITVWSREEDLTEELVRTKGVKFPLKIQLDQRVEITSDLKAAINDAKIVLVVVSSQAVRPVCQRLRDAGIKQNQILVSASKGLELPGLYRLSEVYAQELPKNEFAVLSGPTLAGEVIKGFPTAASIASESRDTANFLQEVLTVQDKFRLYSNTDVIGVELGGSLKNVIAIASGFVSALNLGDNAKGALLARGLAEIVRISVAMGANPSTLYGLSGVGDLFATCSSPLSRNYRVGYMLGQGKKLDDILREIGAVAEGVKTSQAVVELAERLGLEAPVSEAIYKAVYTDITPVEIVSMLMNRKLKPEDLYNLSP